MLSSLTRTLSPACTSLAAIALSCALIFNSAPAAAAGAGFIGTWKNVKYPKETLTISKEGKRLSIVEMRANMRGGYMAMAPIPADVKDDAAVVNPFLRGVLRENGNLLYGNEEYTR